MAAFLTATISRLARALRRAGARRPAAPELWCRPATVLALRNQAKAPTCVEGWR